MRAFSMVEMETMRSNEETGYPIRRACAPAAMCEFGLTG